jgi:hypothetical protein
VLATAIGRIGVAAAFTAAIMVTLSMQGVSLWVLGANATARGAPGGAGGRSPREG